ncbi:MAG TPA: Plug domain-containing protein, partial [Nitrospirae bacterium]|nr:Plug domain-containing protein [Nitrospirota bacterium]
MIFIYTGIIVPLSLYGETVGTGQQLEEISITATRLERKTEEVPASVAIVGEDRLKDTKMFNLKEALIGTPGVLIDTRNQGYDSRLIIRGSGLKARYGVREIMVLLNGVPITDPDSLTRLDFIDTQLIE